MELNYQIINKISKEYGEAFYLLDSVKFKKNYIELQKEFSKIYPKFNIAYSYKTNYIPKLCSIVESLGGYAEVVSDMELELALRIGVKPEKIIWNGPYKNLEKVQDFLLKGGTVNLDSEYEITTIKKIASKYSNDIINVGIRCNFDIGDNVISRFGFDIESKLFNEVIDLFLEFENINLKSIQCHFATRTLETWKPRVIGMLNILEKFNIKPDCIDLGGGLFGKMDKMLQEQFDTPIPTYEDYAKEVGNVFSNYFKNKNYMPYLLIEPGTAIVGDCMQFITKVINIKNVKGKYIATLLGSIYNINPTLNKKNPPLTLITSDENKSFYYYRNLDFGGFTCIESDYLYKGYNGKLRNEDFIIFSNIGSYSVVLKPPFILPNFAILEITDRDDIEVIKRRENFEDIFHTYNF